MQLFFISECLWLSILKSQLELAHFSIGCTWFCFSYWILAILKWQFLAAVNVMNVNTVILSGFFIF